MTDETKDGTIDSVKKTKASKSGTKKFRLIIHNQEGPEGKQAVFVSVQGVGYNIPRNTESIVPESVVETLRNAEYTLYDDKGKASNARRFMIEATEIEGE